MLVEALGLGADVAVNPSGGPLAANPIMATGLVRISEAADQIRDRGKHRTLAHSTSGPCLQQNLVCILESPPSEGAQRSGQVSHQTVRHRAASVRPTTSVPAATCPTAGWSGKRRCRALDDAQMTWSDIDAVVVGKAPDLFEGVMKPELYLTDALGATGKPMFRVHTAGSVGGTTGIVGLPPRGDGPAPRRARGRAREAVRGQRAVRARHPAAGASIGAGGAFAPYMRSYMYRTGAPADIGPMVAVKDRQNAMKNEYAHLEVADISLESVKASPMMWDPVRFLESCPSSDGACAVVFTDEAGGEAAAADGPSAGVDPRLRGALGAGVVPRP